MAAMVLRQAQVKLWHLRADAWCCRTIGLRQAIDGMAVFREIQWIGLRENLQETMVFTIKYRAFL